MNKIESSENLLSSSSAAAEKSWIMQLRKREEEGRQLYLRNQLSLHGELPRTKEWKKKKNPFLLLLVAIKSGKLEN